MKKIQSFFLAAICIAALSSSHLYATTFFISPDGKDGAAGTQEEPLRRIQEGLDRAQAGDTVMLLPGVYREKVKFTNGGEYGKPVILTGSRESIIDGSDKVELKWTPAPEIGEHVYKTPLPFQAYTVTANGKIITMIDERRTDPEVLKARIERIRRLMDDPSVPEGKKKVPRNNVNMDWQWPIIFKKGIGPSKWEGVKALGMYRRKEKELIIRFKNGLDPRDFSMTISRRRACIKISDANRCVVRGITLRNSWYGVLISDSIGSVVEDCRITAVDYVVRLSGGASQCTMRFNEISMDPYSGASPKNKGSWDNWQAHKSVGFYDRIGIDMRHTVGGHHVHDNYIHDHWGGIQDVGNIGENKNLNVHHNRIDIISDDGLEPNGAEENCQWHDNIVSECICGFRIKCVKKGPLYAYRNIFFKNSEDYRNYGEHEMKPARVYVYHNTSSSSAAITSNKIFGIGTPNYRFFNNLHYCRRWFHNSCKSVEPNWKGDFNVYIRRNADRRWDAGIELAKKLGIDQNSAWYDKEENGFKDFDARDVSLLENSPARGSGCDLEKVLGEKLPGLEEKYYTGETPDAGALQYGQPMPVLPRKRADVKDVPEAGFWPGKDAEEKLKREAAEQARLMEESQRFTDVNVGKCKTLDLSQASNMAFQDEISGDGKGGAFDQGGNDLRSFPVGRRSFCGVPFNIINPTKNNGKSMITLNGTHAPTFPEKSSSINVGAKARKIYFLHTAAWCSRGYFYYIINYENGRSVKVPVGAGKEIADWWSPSPDAAKNAKLAWSGQNLQSKVGVFAFRWDNPTPAATINTIDIQVSEKHKDRTIIPGIIAITAEQ